MSVPVVLQAGGKGTRLLPYTSVLPKPLMPVGDMPILEIVVTQLVRSGFNEIYVTTGHLGHLIESYFGDGSRWNARIAYLKEDKPLGTIGPVRLVQRPEVPFIVMNGDLLTDLDYRAFYESHLSGTSDLTVAVYEESVSVSLGVIEFDLQNEIVGFREKPNLSFWASMGIYVFSPHLWDSVPSGKYDGFDTLMADMLRNGDRVKVYPWRGLWLDIGRPEDYERAAQTFEQYRARFLD